MPEDYPVSQLLSDMMAVISDAMVYIIPAAILISGVAFVVAWFFDAIDLAGKTFGRHK